MVNKSIAAQKKGKVKVGKLDKQGDGKGFGHRREKTG